MSKPRALLIRMDKLGDLVLSLPVDQALELADYDKTWLIGQGTGFIAAHAEPKRTYQEFPKRFSFGNLMRLTGWIRALKPQLAVVFHAPWWVGLALLLAGVPNRAGRKSQWHSFLFFNRGVRQSRKSGNQHESESNLELVQRCLNSVMPPRPLPALKLKAPARSLDRWNLPAREYIVVHPGMAGSALNWPAHLYIELIRYLGQRLKIVITGTALDRPMLDQIKSQLGDHSMCIWLDEKLNADELLIVLDQARAVVAPSTGVVHLAASLGTPVVGIYSPIPVQRPSRWGSRGPNVKNLTAPATVEEAQSDPVAAMSKLHPVHVLSALEELGVSH